MAETADVLECENTAYEEREERIKTEAFEDGKLEGLGADTQAAFREHATQINDLKTQVGHARELLGTCHAWLTGDQGKTIKGRREASNALSSRMVMRGLGYPQH